MKADITRRRVLWALVAVGATVGLARLARLPPFDSRVRGSLRALLTDLASAERVGSAYVEQHPEEADPALLEARIAGSQADAERIFGEMRPDELASWISCRPPSVTALARPCWAAHLSAPTVSSGRRITGWTFPPAIS